MEAEDEIRRAEEMADAIRAGAEERAKTIQPNECPGCGAYRLDGHPPEVHKHGCLYEGDGLDRTLKRMFGIGGTDAD